MDSANKVDFFIFGHFGPTKELWVSTDHIPNVNGFFGAKFHIIAKPENKSWPSQKVFTRIHRKKSNGQYFL
jgi:hypothetical protein